MQILNLCLYVYAKKGLPVFINDRKPITIAVGIHLINNAHPMNAIQQVRKFERLRQIRPAEMITQQQSLQLAVPDAAPGPYKLFVLFLTNGCTADMAKTYMRDRVLHTNCFILCNMW